MLYINDATCFIPNNYLEIEQASRLLNFDKNQTKVYKQLYGIEKIPCAANIKLIELIKNPIIDLIKQNQLDKKAIKYLIHCHTAKVLTPFGDSIVRQVKEELGLDETIAFGMSVNNCASAMSALDMLAHVLLEKEQAIIVCADCVFTPVLRFIPNTAILGDASAAVLLAKQGKHNKLIAMASRTMGEYAEGLWLVGEKMQAFEIAYAHLVADIILSALVDANLTKHQVRLIIPHNVNLLSWKRIAAILQVPLDKIFLENIKKYSHCFGADIFINYITAKNQNLLQPGDYYVMATVGLGAVFSAAVFKY